MHFRMNFVCFPSENPSWSRDNWKQGLMTGEGALLCAPQPPRRPLPFLDWQFQRDHSCKTCISLGSFRDFFWCTTGGQGGLDISAEKPLYAPSPFVMIPCAK